MIRDYDMLSRMQQIISQAPTWKKKIKDLYPSVLGMLYLSNQ